MESLLFPELCLCCEELLVPSEKYICLHCQQDLPYTHFQNNRNALAKQFWGRLPFQEATALFYFQKKGKIQKLIHHLKYKQQAELGVYLGQLLAQHLQQQNNKASPFEIIIAVPLHPAKQKERGYNQSQKIAEGISAKLMLPTHNEILLRKKIGESQTRKTKFTRYENMKEVFEVNTKNAELLKGKHVLLIDDVITTGATIEACGNVL